jgi:hypothetical protein
MTILKTTKRARILTAAAGFVLGGMMALALATTPAHADPRHGGDRGHDRGHWRGRGGYVYAPPVVYAPPPPVESPGLNLIIPFNFR